jgi:CPA1 family monovalent cation:H+ antiporter
MEMLTLALFLVIAVLLSAVIDQVVPRVSLPLIQVVMGVIIAIIANGTIVIELEPDLFLVLFIAPLLYLEAKHADKALLWATRRPVLALAVGLVVVSAIVIGFVVHSLVPTITLAAAFALGAALGPTDAVAVTSLEKQVSIPKRVGGMLKGELLLNDASGIVSFQFALGAATTGAFSLLDASVDFLVEFLGGLIVGAVLGFAANYVLRKIRDLGIESTTFHVLYEICVPFVVYLLADSLGVSGVIAVVVAGLVDVIAPRTTSPAIAQMNIVSNNVWDVISFMLNGIVFILLGTQIPTSMVYALQDDTLSNSTLLIYVLLITLVLYAVRFGWCVGMEAIHARRCRKKFDKHNVKNALIMTLCGAKGTITLSILFTIPVFMSTTGARFPERNLIIFLGCGVILCTLLVATFVVPLVAPKPKRSKAEIESRTDYFDALSDILRNVIEELTVMQTRNNRRAINAVIKAYQDRIDGIREDTSEEEDGEAQKLRIQTLHWEATRTRELIAEGKINKRIAMNYLDRLERIESLILHRGGEMSLRRVFSRMRISLMHFTSKVRKRVPDSMQSLERAEYVALERKTFKYAIEHLRDAVAGDAVATEYASKLLIEYQAALSALKDPSPSVTQALEVADDANDIWRQAYQIELEQIQHAYEEDKISRAEARRMRENVSLMQMDLNDRF